MLISGCSLHSIDYLHNDTRIGPGLPPDAQGQTEQAGSVGDSSSGASDAGLQSGGSGNTAAGESGIGAAGSGTGGAAIDSGTAGSGGDAGSTDSGNNSSCDVAQNGCPPMADDTPYVLRPLDDTTKCVDVSAHNVNDNTRAIQSSCQQGISQVFWAIDRGAGSFAFRSALSGKCLDIYLADPAAGAHAVLGSCSYASNELWTPSPTSGGALKLTAKHSGLALDVDGTESTAAGQGLQQSKYDGRLDMQWKLERAASGYAMFSSTSGDGTYLQHHAQAVQLSSASTHEAGWKIVQGLGDPGCVSLEARDNPGHFLRHRDALLSCDDNDGGAAFAAEATFCFKAPLAGSSQTAHTLMPINVSNQYLVRLPSGVAVAASDSSAAFKQAATWEVGQN